MVSIYEEGHRIFTIREFEELVNTVGIAYVWEKLDPKVKEILGEAIKKDAPNKH